jgi:hypothetical protein
MERHDFMVLSEVRLILHHVLFSYTCLILLFSSHQGRRVLFNHVYVKVIIFEIRSNDEDARKFHVDFVVLFLALT